MMQAATTPPLHVLLVDDDEDDCALTGDLVSQIRVPRRAELRCATTYDAGLAALRRNGTDVCLLDYRLGAKDGLELLIEARSQGCACPIIVLTGKGADGTDTLAMSRGADDYLSKEHLSVALLERSIRYAIERAHHVDELRSSEQRYRSIFEKSSEGILIVDIETHAVRYANPAASRMSGHSRTALCTMSLDDLSATGDQESNLEAFNSLARGTTDLAVNRRCLRKDGVITLADVSATTISLDGRPMLVGFFRDVTERAQSVRALEASEAQYRRLFEAAKDGIEALRLRDRAIQAVSQGILISDAREPGNPIIYASPGVTRLTGYEPEEVLGRTCAFLQGPGTDPASVVVLRDAVREERFCVVELVNYRKDGTAFWNSVALSPVREAGGPVTHFVGVQTDVTARRQLESQFLQAQKMEAVGRLAGGVAHDFNNLLTVILSYADLIDGELKADEPMRADIQEIKTAGLRATDLTRQLLAFSRQQVLEFRVLNLNEVLAGMEKMLGRLLGADIELTILPGLGLGNVKADPGQLEQIVMNLAVNARDALPAGGQLTVKTENVELDDDYAKAHHDVRPGSYVELAVSDNGSGMDKETLRRLFEPFFTTKERGKGTGLGLATVFGIVKQSGGHIFVNSEPAEGTTFRIYLPRVDAVADSLTPVQPVPDTERVGGTILLVEDEDQVRGVARTILRRQGYVVLEAPNGGEALLICEQHGATIDLLLTDVVLPRMSGRQLAERLASVRPAMKVLYMSGYTDDAILQRGIIDSGVAFLQKPLTPASLTRKVREVLRGVGIL